MARRTPCITTAATPTATVAILSASRPARSAARGRDFSAARPLIADRLKSSRFGVKQPAWCGAAAVCGEPQISNREAQAEDDPEQQSALSAAVGQVPSHPPIQARGADTSLDHRSWTRRHRALGEVLVRVRDLVICVVVQPTTQGDTASGGREKGDHQANDPRVELSGAADLFQLGRHRRRSMTIVGSVTNRGEDGLWGVLLRS